MIEHRIESEVYLRHDLENILKSLAMAHGAYAESGFYRALACVSLALHLNDLATEFNELEALIGPVLPIEKANKQ